MQQPCFLMAAFKSSFQANCLAKKVYLLIFRLGGVEWDLFYSLE